MENLVYAIILLPLFGFLINGLFGKSLPKMVVGSIATLVVFASFCIAVSLFLNFEADSQPVIVRAFEWFRVNGMQVNFSFQIDQLSLMMIMIILGLISWPGLARLIRGQILAEREKDFVLAARALGIKSNVIILRHILPNIINIVIVSMTLSYAGSLLTEAGLSFLGFGVVPPSPSWGNMLNGAQQSSVIQLYWWRWILPAVCVLIAALSVNIVGDGLRDAMDPKANEK